jgi:hypothetical protein
MSMQEYEARREAERAAEAARVREFGILMEVVALELAKAGEGAVMFRPRVWDDVAQAAGELVFADGLELHASTTRIGYGAAGKYRLVFSMNVPREADGTYRSLRDYQQGDVAPEITVGADATPERIAKEIRRRLIVDFDLRARLAKVLEIQASRAAFARGKEALARELFALAEQAPREREFEQGRDAEIRLYGFAPGVSYGHMRVSGDDSVRVELSVNGAVAREILALLKARRSA